MNEHSDADGVGAGASLRTSTEIDRAHFNSARQAAEALFAPKQPVTEYASAATALSIAQVPRKPRVLSAIPVQPADAEPTKPPVEREPPRPQQIPPTHSARIRTWLKYGMTVRQAAEVYAVSVSEIERVLQEA